MSSIIKGGRAHLRYAHSIKVAQVGRAIAGVVLRSHLGVHPDLEDFLDPTVVETAGLAHDIGHPPIAHLGEETLQQWRPDTLPFEGNAQTFRVLVYHGDRTFGEPGFDLTRASVSAAVKYPWSCDDPKAEKGKFGFYAEDEEAFRWATQGTQAEVGKPTLEAQIMDWADDITYAVHDAQDYFRDGLIPLERVLYPGDTHNQYLDYLVTKLQADEKWLGWRPDLFERSAGGIDWDKTRALFSTRLLALGNTFVGLDELGPYNGSFDHRSALVGGAAALLGTLIEGPTGTGEPLPFGINRDDEGFWSFNPNRNQHADVFVLKALLWWSVVPRLRAEQSVRSEWTSKVLEELWRYLKGERTLPWDSPVLDNVAEGTHDDSTLGRFVMDAVSGMTDAELEALYVVLAEPGKDHPDKIDLAKTTPLPLPPGFERAPQPLT